MATALSIALKSCIEDNWSAVTGGTEPTVYGTEHMTWPSEDEWIRIMGWTFDMGGFVRRNETYVGYWEEITFEVSTKNHADLESRLDEMTNELKSIITPTNLTGYHTVDIVRRTRAVKDEVLPEWKEQMTVRATILSTDSAATPGSTTASTLTVDTLTVNTSIAGSPTAALGATTVAGNITVTGTVDGVDIAAEPARISTEIDTDIATHTAIEAAHGMEHDDLTDTTITGAYLEDLLMFGSGNAAYVPCALEGTDRDPSTEWEHSVTGIIENKFAAGTQYYTFVCPMPTNKGSLKLYVAGTTLSVAVADATDYSTAVTVYGCTGATNDSLDSDATNRTAAGDHVNTFTAVDASGYALVKVRVAVVGAAADEFQFNGVSLKCYYAT
jgi:hypothetical protein